MNHTLRVTRRPGALSRRNAWALVAAGVSLALTGCGSTALRTTAVPVNNGYVQNESGQFVDPSTGEIVDPAQAGGGLSAGVPGGVGSTGPGSVTAGGLGGSPGTGSPGIPVPGAPGTKAPASAPVAGPLTVGVMTVNVDAIAAVFGQKPGDRPKFWEAWAKKVNANGGVAGRKVKIVTSEIRSDESASVAAQRACATFTQDNKVNVVVSQPTGTDVLAACLKAAGVPLIDGSFVGLDRTMATQFPNWIFPAAIRSDRLAAAQMQQAVSSGLLKRGSNLGVLIEDCPANKRVRDTAIKPAAANAGVKVTEGSFRCVQSLVGDLAGVSNDIQRETLRFASAGVTHVIIVSIAEAFALSNFTKNASQQKYFPKYLATSLAYPFQDTRSDAIIKISSDAVPNIYGMGIAPLLDTGSQAAVNAAQASARRYCDRIEPTRNNVADAPANSRPFQLQGFYSLCDGFRVLQLVLEANGGRTAYPDFANGFRTLLSKGGGSSVFPTGSFAPASAERTDGASVVRAWKYNGSSQQWIYYGNPIRVP